MEEQTKQNKVIAYLVLTVLTVFLVYITYTFVPGWAYHFKHNEGKAIVEVVNKERYIIEYTYYNNFKEREIRNIRSFKNKNDIYSFNKGAYISITYAKYFPGYVKFESIDKLPVLSLTIIVYLLILIAISLYIGVLLNKVSLEMLLGVKQKGNSTEEIIK